MDERHPKVFVSYAWTSDEYVKKVYDFVKRLRSDGIETVFDQFDLMSGNSLNDFMEKTVSDESVTHVLMLLNPAYKAKADKREGGAGRETQIISEEVYSHLDNQKFKPIVFDLEDKQIADVVPIYLKNRMYIDLSNIETYEDNYRALVREIYGKPHMLKTTLGIKPDWVDRPENINMNIGALALIRESMARGVEKVTYRKALDILERELLKTISALGDCPFSAERFEESYSAALNPFRNLCVSCVEELIEIDKIDRFVMELFELYTQRIPRYGNARSYLKVLKQELIIEMVAILYKKRKYAEINRLVLSSYELDDNWEPCVNFNGFYYAWSDSSVSALDEALGVKLGNNGRRLLTGIGDFWARNCPVDYLSVTDFANADVLLSSLCAICLRDRWFSITYIYAKDEGLWIRRIAKSFESKQLFLRYAPLFGDMALNQILIVAKEDKEAKQQGWWGYHNCMRTIPFLSERIDFDKAFKQ